MANLIRFRANQRTINPPAGRKDLFLHPTEGFKIRLPDGTEEPFGATIVDDDDVVEQIVQHITQVQENNTYIEQIVQNETFVTQLIEYLTELTEIEQNNTYVTNVINQITNVLNGKKGQALELATLDADGKLTATQVRESLLTAAIQYVIPDGSTGVKGEVPVPFDCVITGWTILLDVAGSVVVDIWKDDAAHYPPTDADSITAAAPPTVAGAAMASSSTLTGWTTALAAGDILRFNVDSMETATRATLMLKVRRTP